MPFSPETKTAMFVRCMRHCCLCRKQCGTNIEAAHIIDEAAGGSNDEENGIPTCFDCHQEIGAYRDSHPKGNKFRPDELRQRRDAVYELVRTGQLGPATPVKHESQVNAAVFIGPNGINISGANAVKLKENAINIVGPVVHNENQPEALPLSDLEFNILVQVSNKERVTAKDVAMALAINEQKAKYYLDEMEVRKLVNWIGNMNPKIPVYYSLTHVGRGVLVMRGVFD